LPTPEEEGENVRSREPCFKPVQTVTNVSSAPFNERLNADTSTGQRQQRNGEQIRKRERERQRESGGGQVVSTEVAVLYPPFIYNIMHICNVVRVL